MRRASLRGFTMVELMLTVALTGLVVGAVASVYGFVAVRLGDAYTQAQVIDQVNDVADRIEATIRESDFCAVSYVNAALICSMPQNGIDADGDGHFDSYYPDGTDANGQATYTVGRYYWIFNAAADGNFTGASSGYVWRADSAKNVGTPRPAENDLTFTYWPGTPQRMRDPLVSRVSFVVDPVRHAVTFTLTGGNRMGSDSRDTCDPTNSRTYTVTRTVVWRN